MTPEGKIQRYTQKSFKAIGGLVRKVSYEGRIECADLLVVLPGGIVLFIEVKRSSSTAADAHQVREHDRLKRRGANVFVVGSVADVDRVVAEFTPVH